MKCQREVDIEDPYMTKTKTGQPMVKGECALCMRKDGGKGTTVCRFLPRKK